MFPLSSSGWNQVVKLWHTLEQQAFFCKILDLEQVISQYRVCWSCLTSPGYLLHSCPELTWDLSDFQAGLLVIQYNSNQFSLFCYFRWFCHVLLFTTKCLDDIDGVWNIREHRLVLLYFYPYLNLIVLKKYKYFKVEFWPTKRVFLSLISTICDKFPTGCKGCWKVL